jgi:hypothetical protein
LHGYCGGGCVPGRSLGSIAWLVHSSTLSSAGAYLQYGEGA